MEQHDQVCLSPVQSGRSLFCGLPPGYSCVRPLRKAHSDLCRH
jgi:hypothetical protein